MEYTLFCLYMKCRCENKHLDVHLRRIISGGLLSNDIKDASHEGRDGWKKCLFCARVGVSALIFVHASTFP